MKKKIVALLLCCTALCCTIATTSNLGFKNIIKPSITANAKFHFHSRSNSYVVDKKPTCTAKGKGHYNCKTCGKKMYSITIKKLGHVFSPYMVSKKATCTSAGQKYRKCTRGGCNHKEYETVKATGHSYSWVTTKNPTCTSKGNQSYRCIKCANVKKTKAINALGHSNSWTTTKNATCTKQGTKSYKCKRCSSVAKTKPIKALGHNYKKQSSQGRNYKQCKNCNGKIYTASDYKKDFEKYLKSKGFSEKEATMIFNYMSKNGKKISSSSSFLTLMDYVDKISKVGDLTGKEYVAKLSTISTAGTIAYNANSYIKSLKNKNDEAILNSFIDLTSNICDLCPLTKGYSKVLTSLKSNINNVIKLGKQHNYKSYYAIICADYGEPTLADLSNKTKYNKFVKFCKKNFSKDASYVVDYYIQDLIDAQFKAITGKTLNQYFELFNK